MCIINFHLNNHPTYKLIVAANRDEFFKRPTKEAHEWEDAPNVIAGRDLEQHGTWLGVTKQGKFAALTNYRSLDHMSKDKKTRGKLVSNFLMENDCPSKYINHIRHEKEDYNGFNLIIATPEEMIYYNNINDHSITVQNGTHSLSNEFLNSSWPKVNLGKSLLHEYVTRNEEIHYEPLFDILLNKDIAPDDQLPNTGVDFELERHLSPIFINTPQYGTRSSTVLLITKNNEVTFVERTYLRGRFLKERKFFFTISSSND